MNKMVGGGEDGGNRKVDILIFVIGAKRIEFS